MRRTPAPLLLALLVAGCDRDPAELAREVNEARAGCTEEKLRAADEECIRMMERYAGMGTEAMEGYIGAVKSLDQALQRMPVAQFDTTMGHPFSRPSPSAAGATRVPAAPTGEAGGFGAEAYPSARSRAEAGRWAAPRDAEAPAYEDRYDDRYDERYGAEYDDRYEDRDPRAPGGGRWSERPGYGGYDPYDPYAGGWGPRDRGGYPPPGYGYDPPRGYGTDPRYGADRYGDWGWYDDPRAYRDPRARRFPENPRGRGLRPPEERLRRPWLEDEAVGRYHGSIRSDTIARLRPRPRRNEEP